MTWTIPRAFGLVPIHQAPQMRADGGAQAHLALLIAIGSDLLPANLQDLALIATQRANGAPFRYGQAIFQQVVGVIFVLLEVIPRPGFQHLTIGTEELAPGVFSSRE